MTQSQTNDISGKRFASGIIDYLIIWAFFFAYVLLLGETNAEGGKTVTGWPALGPVAFWFIWLVVAEAIFGTTLGHYINGLRIVDLDGEKISFSQALKRRLCDIIEIAWCFGLIAYVIIRNTEYRQRLGDIWAKTLVVDKNAEFHRDGFEFEGTGKLSDVQEHA